MSSGLDEKERSVLELLRVAEERGYVPDVEHIRNRTGIPDEATILSIITKLKRERYIQENPRAIPKFEVLRGSDGTAISLGRASYTSNKQSRLGQPHREPAKKRSRQEDVLEALRELTESQGYPPNLKELAAKVGLSVARTYALVDALDRDGRVKRDRMKARGIKVLDAKPSPSTTTEIYVQHGGEVAANPTTGRLSEGRKGELIGLGRELLDQNEAADVFMLEVRGDSMSGAGVLDGDLVLVRRQSDATSGDMVIAELPGSTDELELMELTIKYVEQGRGHRWLLPAAPGYEAVDNVKAKIIGKVIGLVRPSIRPWLGATDHRKVRADPADHSR
jgi:repressor LexA